MGNARSLTVFIIVGDQVFPKGIANQRYRGDSFAEGDVDSAQIKFTTGITGMKVSRQGRLFVADDGTEVVAIFDAASGDLYNPLANSGHTLLAIMNVLAIPNFTKLRSHGLQRWQRLDADTMNREEFIAMFEPHRTVQSCHDATWLALPLDEWLDTYTTLHMWTQIVGKIRLALTPHVNHWWQVPLYVTASGLTTSPMAYQGRIFQIDFDFLHHKLQISTEDGAQCTVALEPRSVADFYHALMAALRELSIHVWIWTVPVEVQERIPFEQDTEHASYDAVYVQRFWRILVQADRVLKIFRAGYVGKVSPVHFFWGAFDLSVTRFSGRRAPLHPGVPNVARSVMREAYSHEVSSCGFWPGTGLGTPAFYAYAYSEPAGFKHYPVAPDAAFYDEAFGEFLLPYEAVRTAFAPDELLLAFLQTTYEAAANLAEWDRAGLERVPELGSRGRA